MFHRRSAAVGTAKENHLNNKICKVKSDKRKWLKFLMSALIPLMIGIFTSVTTVLQQDNAIQQRDHDEQEALLQREQSNAQADNLRQENVFAKYLDDMTKLLMLGNETKYLMYIRSKTLSTLRQLDPVRKNQIILFLYDNMLIYRHPDRAISTFLKLNEADFNGIYFRGTLEFKCNFLRLYLHDVYLSDSSFTNCALERANFSYSNMLRSLFLNTLLVRASFSYCVLDNSNFTRARLSFASFRGASLVNLDFTGAVWLEKTVDFTNSNLTGAILSTRQLNNVEVNNSVLPNGTWGSILTENLVVNGDLEQNCRANQSDVPLGWGEPKDGDIRVLAYHDASLQKTLGKCYLRVTAFNTIRKVAYVSQTFSVEHFSLLISTGMAKYDASMDVQCFGAQYALFEIRFIDLHGLVDIIIYSDSVKGTDMETIGKSGVLRVDVRAVRLIVTFITLTTRNTTLETDYCTCDNVKFSIRRL